MTLVTNVSMMTGKTHSMEINVDFDKLQAWRMGLLQGLIQDVFPELSPAEREFLLTGITPEEWETLKDEDDE